MKVSDQIFWAHWKGIAKFQEFLNWLGKYAPVKRRYIRASQKKITDKELKQAIIVNPLHIRSKLRNKFLKLKIEENRVAYAKQRNYYVKLLQQKKRQCTLKT